MPEPEELNQMLNSSTFLEGKEEPEVIIEKKEPEQKEEGEKPNPHLDSLHSIFNEGIEKDDDKIIFDEKIFNGKKDDGTDYTIDEKRQHIIETLLNKTTLGKTKEVDTFVRDIITKSFQDDFDLEQIKPPANIEPDISDVNTIVKKVYTMKYGPDTDANLTEEEIEEKLKTISDADKKLIVADFKQAIKQVQAQKREEEIKKQDELLDKQVDQYNKDTDAAVKMFVEQSKTKDVFAGFKFGQADKEEYLKDIPMFMKREKSKLEDGGIYAISPAEKVLQDIIKDPNSLLELIPFLWLKSKGKLDGYSTMLSEKVKWDILDRLDGEKNKYIQNSNSQEADMRQMLDAEAILI